MTEKTKTPLPPRIFVSSNALEQAAEFKGPLTHIYVSETVLDNGVEYVRKDLARHAFEKAVQWDRLVSRINRARTLKRSIDREDNCD